MTEEIEAAVRALRNAVPGHRNQARRRLREALHAELRRELAIGIKLRNRAADTWPLFEARQGAGGAAT